MSCVMYGYERGADAEARTGDETQNLRRRRPLALQPRQCLITKVDDVLSCYTH